MGRPPHLRADEHLVHLFCASNLEAEWGSFKLNVYYFVGLVFSTGAIILVQRLDFFPHSVASAISGNFLNMSLLFAVATLNPSAPVTFFFIPVQLKWLAFLDLGYMVYLCVRIDAPAGWTLMGAALVNYFVFFGGHLLGFARGQALITKQAVRRASAAKSDPAISAVKDRTCAICGVRQSDGADIRVCSCEKCGGAPRDLCLAHARNH